MKKSFLLLAMTSLLSTQALSKDISFSNPRTILPNEDIQSFELADLDGNGIQEIIYLTSNGELKYAIQGHYIDESSRDLLRSTEWVVDGYTDVKLSFSSTSYSIWKRDSGYGSSLVFKDGTYRASPGGDRNNIMIDYISDTKISGKFTCNRCGIYYYVPFTATPK
ncbi:hypothetical protein MHO82_01865 [Vibrio sp. Of7-15]|uniref:hypothetical protein n=1 Tax=Vibrio sp. Of7-15 TaxID=2724879 RepID=UPI001EF25836|nr:hypothetical protein [Vibrio sp. Of7-15]MCG7495608.1 hypothetical protein [Vibrio sp. Of7-15]